MKIFAGDKISIMEADSFDGHTAKFDWLEITDRRENSRSSNLKIYRKNLGRCYLGWKLVGHSSTRMMLSISQSMTDILLFDLDH
jgi:hypothetical protein